MEHDDLYRTLHRLALRHNGFWCPGCTKWQRKATGFGVWADEDEIIRAAYLICEQCRKKWSIRMDEFKTIVERRVARLYERGLLNRRKGILNVTKEML